MSRTLLIQVKKHAGAELLHKSEPLQFETEVLVRHKGQIQLGSTYEWMQHSFNGNQLYCLSLLWCPFACLIKSFLNFLDIDSFFMVRCLVLGQDTQKGPQFEPPLISWDTVYPVSFGLQFDYWLESKMEEETLRGNGIRKANIIYN